MKMCKLFSYIYISLLKSVKLSEYFLLLHLKCYCIKIVLLTLKYAFLSQFFKRCVSHAATGVCATSDVEGF